MKTLKIQPKTPPMEDQDHRPSQAGQTEHEQQTAGPLTEQDIIQLLNPVGVQFASMKALENLQQFLNGRLQEQVEIEQRRKGNITVCRLNYFYFLKIKKFYFD